MRTPQHSQRQRKDDDDNVLKEGTLVVPMRLMDSARAWGRDISVSGPAHQPGFIDAKPKKQEEPDEDEDEQEKVEDGRRALADAYQSYDAEVSQRWRNIGNPAIWPDSGKACADCGKPNSLDASFCDSCGQKFTDAEPLANVTGAGSRVPTRGQQAGDVCTIDGRPGVLRSVNGELKCVPRSRAASPTSPARRELYDPALGAVRPHGAGYNKDASAGDPRRRKVQYRDPFGREAGTAEEEDADAKDAAYQQYDAGLRDAWRRAR